MAALKSVAAAIHRDNNKAKYAMQQARNVKRFMPQVQKEKEQVNPAPGAGAR
jgi:hypothetical protein